MAILHQNICDHMRLSRTGLLTFPHRRGFGLTRPLLPLRLYKREKTEWHSQGILSQTSWKVRTWYLRSSSHLNTRAVTHICPSSHWAFPGILLSEVAGVGQNPLFCFSEHSPPSIKRHRPTKSCYLLMHKEASKQINQQSTMLISKVTREFVLKLNLSDYSLGKVEFRLQGSMFPRSNGRSFLATGPENLINQRQSTQHIGRTIRSAAKPGRGYVNCSSQVSIWFTLKLALLLVEKGVDEVNYIPKVFMCLSGY